MPLRATTLLQSLSAGGVCSRSLVPISIEMLIGLNLKSFNLTPVSKLKLQNLTDFIAKCGWCKQKIMS